MEAIFGLIEQINGFGYLVALALVLGTLISLVMLLSGYPTKMSQRGRDDFKRLSASPAGGLAASAARGIGRAAHFGWRPLEAYLGGRRRKGRTNK